MGAPEVPPRSAVLIPFKFVKCAMSGTGALVTDAAIADIDAGMDGGKLMMAS
jgi:hypothetical protein